jgi:kynurenine formamidase
MLDTRWLSALVLATAACAPPPAQPPQSAQPIQPPAASVPSPPWPAGDERGMANAVGPATWSRCAPYLADGSARAYELSHVRSNTMPLSPFAGPYEVRPAPTSGLPGTRQAFNNEILGAGASPGQQGTQMDAFGHFGVLPETWDGKSVLPTESIRYYGGFTQKDVKPTPDSPLLKLGIDKVPPLITTAVLLDARQAAGGGAAMKAGQTVSAANVEAMLKAQGLAARGILPGDAVLIYTGWSERYADPDTEKVYYSMAPGLADDAVRYLVERRPVIVGIDTPFVDAIADGQLAGTSPPPPGTPEAMAFASHQRLLVEAGVHTFENAKLDELIRDKVLTSCVMILPLREKGAAGSPVRPVAIGVPGR